jgi:OPA family glycerol-3-phosphate transporter-like MFS transporter
MTPSDPPAKRPDDPRVAALPGDAPPVDYESLAHIRFPPGFRARRGLNWAAIGLLYTSFYMCRYNFPIANPEIIKQYGFTDAQMGKIITATLAAYACGQIINGLITDRLGGKRAMLIGAAGTIVTNTLFGMASLANARSPFGVFAGQLWLFITLWGINGYLQSFGAPGMVKMNAAWFAREERGTFAGIFGFMINLGRFVINFLGPALIGGFTIFGFAHIAPLHWRWLFWVPAMVCALVAIFMATVVAETPERAGYDYARSHDSHNDAGATADFKVVLVTILSNPGIWITGCAYLCTGVVRQCVDQWFPRYMTHVHSLKLNSEKFEWLGFLIPLVASCGSLLSGIVSDRLFGSRRAPVAGILYLTETIIIFAAAQFHGVNSAILFFVLISFTANSTHSLLGTAAAMDIGGRKMTGFASGMIDSFQYLGSSVIAGWLMGMIVDISWNYYFYVMAPFGLLGAILMFWLGDWITPSEPNAPPPASVVSQSAAEAQPL